MASVLPALLSGSVPRFAADPGAQANNSGLRSMQERVKIEQQPGRIPEQLLHPHARALHSKPNGIHQAGVLSSSPSPPPQLPSSISSFPVKGAQGGQARDKKDVPWWFQLTSPKRSGGRDYAFLTRLSRKG